MPPGKPRGSSSSSGGTAVSQRGAQALRRGGSKRRGPAATPTTSAASADAPGWMHAQGPDVILDVLVAPRASRTRVMGVHDNRLKIQLAAPPVEGQANAALVRFVADALEVARAQVEIVGGTSNRRKTLRLAQVSPTRVLLRLAPRREF